MPNPSSSVTQDTLNNSQGLQQNKTSAVDSKWGQNVKVLRHLRAASLINSEDESSHFYEPGLGILIVTSVYPREIVWNYQRPHLCNTITLSKRKGNT